MKKTRKYSLRTVIWGMSLCLVIPISIFLTVYTAFIVFTIRDKIYDSERSSLNLAVSWLKNTMDSTERFMSNIVMENSDFQLLAEKLEGDEAYYHSYEIEQEMKNLLTSNPGLYALAVVSPANDWYACEYEYLYDVTAQERILIQAAIKKAVSSLAVNSALDTESWFSLVTSNRSYLVRAMRYRSAVHIGLIDLENISNRMKQDYGMEGFLTVYSGEEPLYEDVAVRGQRLDRPEEDEPFRITGDRERYMVLEDELEGFVFLYAAPYQGIQNRITLLPVILVILAAVVMGAVFYAYRFMQKMLIKPIGSLIAAMESVRRGNLKAKPEEAFAVEDLQQMSETFQEMMEEIRNLKIEAYEKELERKQAAFRFLQVQIRPHFYLNCLKNLYGMAQAGEFGEIQKMILLLSKYLRYTFESTEPSVALEGELDQCKNYVELFSVGQQEEQAVLKVNIDAGLAGIRIPPISLLTFVENSLKYALVPERSLEIDISLQQFAFGGSGMIRLTVSDNGRGFPEDILRKLNRGEEITDQQKRRHIGIRNVLERFRMLKGDSFAYVFSNKNGAVIELFFESDEKGLKL